MHTIIFLYELIIYPFMSLDSNPTSQQSAKKVNNHRNQDFVSQI